MLLKSGGLPVDNTIKHTQFLSGVFTAGAVEATFTNYTRTSFSGAGITITVNTSTDVVTLDVSNVVIGAAGGASNDVLGAMLLCYKPTSSTADSAIPVLTKHDVSATTAGGTWTITIPAIATAT